MEADTSTLRKTGHSYFALTSQAALCRRLGFLQLLPERRVRSPMQTPLNKRAVAVAAVHALVPSLYEDDTWTSIRGATG
jgi:hypothetical protein